MFLSKIWFFVLAVMAALALSLALVMPRPAQRVMEQDVEPERVTTARSQVEMLLRESGALVTARDGRPLLESASVMACTPPLYEPFLSLLAEP